MYMYIYIYVCVGSIVISIPSWYGHTYIHAYIHTYIHTYTHEGFLRQTEGGFVPRYYVHL